VDSEVHEAATELEEAETGPKDGRSGPSTWRRLAADGEPVVEAGTSGRGGRRLGRGATQRCTRARGRFGTVREGLERAIYSGSAMTSTTVFGVAHER
jgi:hypothetical protein